MNIGSLGRLVVGATEIQFDSTRTILDFDAVFVDSAAILQGIVKFAQATAFRRSEFLEFLALGRTIVVFTVPLQLEVFLPIQPAGLKSKSGTRMDFKGQDHLKAFWRAVEPDMQFLAYFETPPGRPFLFIAETDKPVATLVQHDKGHLLFLPYLQPHTTSHSVYRERCERFIAAFEGLNSHLAPKRAAVELPAWSAHFGWERERELRTNLLSLQTQADDISNKIITTTSDLAIEDKLKVLFSGKGLHLLRP